SRRFPSSPETPPPTASPSSHTNWRPSMHSSKNLARQPTITPIPMMTSDLGTLSLAEVMRALGLDHAAANLDSATQKAITRNDSPTALVDSLLREQLRVQTEERARSIIKRSCIFPLTTLAS